MVLKSTNAAENVYDTLVMVSIGARIMTLAGPTVYPYGSIDTIFYPPLLPLDSTFNLGTLKPFYFI